MHPTQFYADAFNAIQVNSIQCNSIQLSPIQFNSMKLNSIQFSSSQVKSMRIDSIRVQSIRFESIQCKRIQFNSIQCTSIQSNSIHFRWPKSLFRLLFEPLLGSPHSIVCYLSTQNATQNHEGRHTNQLPWSVGYCMHHTRIPESHSWSMVWLPGCEGYFSLTCSDTCVSSDSLDSSYIVWQACFFQCECAWAFSNVINIRHGPLGAYLNIFGTTICGWRLPNINMNFAVVPRHMLCNIVLK